MKKYAKKRTIRRKKNITKRKNKRKNKTRKGGLRGLVRAAKYCFNGICGNNNNQIVPTNTNNDDNDELNGIVLQIPDNENDNTKTINNENNVFKELFFLTEKLFYLSFILKFMEKKNDLDIIKIYSYALVDHKKIYKLLLDINNDLGNNYLSHDLLLCFFNWRYYDYNDILNITHKYETNLLYDIYKDSNNYDYLLEFKKELKEYPNNNSINFLEKNEETTAWFTNLDLFQRYPYIANTDLKPHFFSLNCLKDIYKEYKINEEIASEAKKIAVQKRNNEIDEMISEREASTTELFDPDGRYNKLNRNWWNKYLNYKR